ncbi:DUF6776 family protein [uncultured Oceanisphaera sp.]|uniref:DUF6776 family protein n=1 Tax=uncultured Oceanisphaera sp. TaxID=353858 RepID=UPI00262A2CB2|nr:DUF6776 family protein [uncultured Oceanisphaera sp.]
MHQPFGRRVMVVSLVINLLLLAVAGYFVPRYQQQSRQLEQHRLQAERHRQELLALRVDLQTLLSAESSQLAQLARQSQQLTEQAQQLALYRQVLAPDGGVELLLAQEDITRLAEPGLFAYRLVLLQPTNTGNRVTGQARLKIRALRQGQPVVLNEEALGVAPVTLDFRHFQVLTGQLRLPVGSLAQTLELQLELDRRPVRTLSLNWPTPDNT